VVNHDREGFGASREDRAGTLQIEFPCPREIGPLIRIGLARQWKRR
jgi:hypothetical protein